MWLMNYKYLLIVFLVCGTWHMNDYAQDAKSKPCSAPEAAQMNFWLGDWVITYPDGSHAYSVVEKELDGCLVHERFRDEGKNYTSETWNVYNTNIHKWQQTRVDNQGAYLQMAGRPDGVNMTLYAKPHMNLDGSNVIMRVEFSNIQANSFEWRWEQSRDNGNSWAVTIQMHYERKK